MIKIFKFTPGQSPVFDLDIQEINKTLEDKNGFVWVSLENTNENEMNMILRDVFKFHPLAIEDCLSNGFQTPKLDEYGAYIFVVANALSQITDFHDLASIEIDFFLGENFLVTSHMNESMPPIESVQKRLERDERLYTHGPDFLCHAILDKLVDDFLPVIDAMEDEIEVLEDKVLQKPNTRTLNRLITLKHSIMTLRRMIGPQRELINRMSRDDLPVIKIHTRLYFRDIYDHLVRFQDISENIRDIVSGSLDIYLNSTSLRLNEIMKALTIVSTIFLPLSFVAGVYGMNFHYFPEITWKLGYLFVWIVFLSIAVGMLTFFKKRGWF